MMYFQVTLLWNHNSFNDHSLNIQFGWMIGSGQLRVGQNNMTENNDKSFSTEPRLKGRWNKLLLWIGCLLALYCLSFIYMVGTEFGWPWYIAAWTVMIVTINSISRP